MLYCFVVSCGYMTGAVSFRWDEEFVARVDRARGDVPRSVFVRRAVERALEGLPSDSLGGIQSVEVREAEKVRPSPVPAPAEQPVSRSEMFRRAGL